MLPTPIATLIGFTVFVYAIGSEVSLAVVADIFLASAIVMKKGC